MVERSPARLLAPAALVAFALAIVLAVVTSGVGGPPPPARSTEATTQAVRPTKPFYTVRSGDNLTSISERTGVPVARLRELNPDLDPQALVPGQRIKLRA